MAGPSLGILLPYAPDDQRRSELDAIVRSLDAKAPLIASFHVRSTAAIKGHTELDEWRPFGLAFVQPAQDESEADAIRAYFGFQPLAEIEAVAFANSPDDHTILGELALFLAARFGGIIDFDGILPITEPLPGKLTQIACSFVPGRQRFYHVGDAAFLQAWLDHPAFRLVK